MFHWILCMNHPSQQGVVLCLFGLRHVEIDCVDTRQG